MSDPPDDDRAVRSCEIATYTTDAVAISGRLTARLFHVPTIRDRWPRWSSWPRSHRRHALDFGFADDALIHEFTTQNLVLDGYLESLAAGNNPAPTHLAFGDGTTAPVATNTALNNEVYRTIVGEEDVSGADLLTSTLLSQNEANGQNIREIGFVDGPTSASWSQLTHIVLDAADQIEPKNSTMTAIFNYTLSFARPV